MTYNYLLGLWGEKGKKRRRIGNNVSLGPVFLSKKRGGLADVSTGLIFLTHTHKKRYKNCQNRAGPVA